MSANRFKNGYVCKECASNPNRSNYAISHSEPQTPVYLRIDKQFKFAGLVVCYEHGDKKTHFAPAVALRDL